MGVFDGVLGGVVGAGMASVVNDLIEKHGGIQGIIAQFQKQGLSATVNSWVGTGDNHPVSPDQVHQTFGTDMIQQMAAKSGLSTDEILQKLAHALPQAIDKLTPGGVAPKV